VLLNPLTSRDVSHYERFTSVHDRLYAAVEPASVTPFTDAALTRGLRGALASVVRQLRPTGVDRVLTDDLPRVRDVALRLSRRAAQLAGKEVSARVDALAAAAAHELETAADQQLGWGVAGRPGVHFLRPLEDPPPLETASWAVLTSLRSVDADAALRIDEDWLPARMDGTVAEVTTAAAESDTAEEEEAW
jgi:hypothetical protein